MPGISQYHGCKEANGHAEYDICLPRHGIDEQYHGKNDQNDTAQENVFRSVRFAILALTEDELGRTRVSS